MMQIGNLVDFKKSICKITSIDRVSGYEIEIEEDKFIWVQKKDIEPIPITEDLLFKCGFILNDENTHVKIYAINENIIFDDLKIVYFKRENKFFRRSIEIKSLHQLQNLYFALTQNELIIEI